MKLYVGNLPYEATELELREVFAPFEPLVDFHYPVDKMTGAYRGFAFITLADRDTGEEAIRSLDGTDFGGRSLRVSEAEDRRKGPPVRQKREDREVPQGHGRPVERKRYKGI